MKQGVRGLIVLLLVINLLCLEGCVKKEVKDEKNMPMGRYIEQDVTGDIKASKTGGFFKTKDDILQLYLSTESGLQIYEQDKNGNWVKAECDWVNQLDESMKFAQNITKDNKGNIYLLYHEFTLENLAGASFITKTTEEITEEKPRKIEVSWEEKGRLTMPHSFGVLDNGEILIAENNRPIERYNLADGSFVRNYEGIPSRFAVSNHKLYQINLEKGAIDVYDGETDKLERSIPCENIDKNTILEVGEDEDLYLIGKFGIKHLMKDGAIWELIVDGHSTTLGMPSYSCQCMGVADGEIFVVLINNAGNIAIKKYTFSKDVPATPITEVTAYSLRTCDSLRQLVSQYQLSHPDVKVTLQVGIEENSTLTRGDAIKALNTELLSGKGPDLILLDGLDINNYIEKGLLADISDCVKDNKEDQQYLENIISAYSDKNKICALPIRFTIPTLWGDKEVIEKAKSIEDLAAYQKAYPDKNVLSYRTPEELINLFFTTASSNWFDHEGQLQEKQMIDFLESVKALANKGQSFEKKIDETMEEVRNPGIDQGDEADVIDVAYDYADTLLVRVGQTLDLLITDATMTTKGNGDFTTFECQSGKLFEPRTILGINAGSKKQEIAKEIIKLALSEEVQKVDVKDGLPVNAVALQYCMEGRSLPQGNAWGIYDEKEGKELWVYLSFGSSNWRVFDKYYHACKEVKVPVTLNETILEIVVEQSREYFQDNMTVEEAAKAIKDKIDLYIAEGN